MTLQFVGGALCYIILYAIAGYMIYISYRVKKGHMDVEFMAKSAPGIILASFAVCLMIGGNVLLSQDLGGKLVPFVLSLPPTFTILVFVGISMSDSGAHVLLAEGRDYIRTERECTKGRTAEVRGELDLAEKYYREALTGNRKKDGTIQLQLGNLLNRLERFDEAAECWQEALKGDLSPEMYVTTAIRLGDLLVDHLHRKQDAHKLWAHTMKIYPRDPATQGLAARIKSLEA